MQVNLVIRITHEAQQAKSIGKLQTVVEKFCKDNELAAPAIEFEYEKHPDVK